MNRRRFLAGSITCLAVAGGAACTTNGTKDTRSTETVSSVMLTVDQRSILVVTPKFHYFFDLSEPVRASIQGSFHPYVRARFSEFAVDLGDRVHGNVTLYLVKTAPPEALQAAIDAGFQQSPSGVELTSELRGSRFTANGAQFSDRYKLNQTYRITVVAQGDPNRMSPVTEIEGKVMIYGILLVVAPQVLFSK